MVIRNAQIMVFEELAHRQFEDEMLAHSKVFAPDLCASFDDEHLRTVIRSAVARAEGYGFTNRGPIRLFIETIFLCGNAFDTDSQHPALGEILRGSGDQMVRADRMYVALVQRACN